MSQTFSQILSEYDGFEKAFWASYSINFSTLDFLIKKDFKQIMNPHYLHLICDGNQLDESISKVSEDSKDMSKLSKLQEYCTISPQFTDGAFHPKILLFSSKTKLLIIVSSANATPSGILSNQDLIGTYYYANDHLESMNDISSLFQYMKGFEGWGDEAREDLNIVEEDFSFLKEDLPTDNVLTIPNDAPLFSQMTKGLPDSKIQKINIFSPFFDDNYSAISQMDDYFKVPVNVFSPQKDFYTSRKDQLSSNVKFYHSDSQINKTFHAKFYEFNYGNESVVFWGSANCSFSGLLSPNRNYEFLIKCPMTKEEIYSIWGSLDNKEEADIEYGRHANEDNEPNNKPVIYVKGISANEEGFTIQLDKPLNDKAVLKGIISNGSIVDFTILSVKGNTITAICEEKGLVILYVEHDNKRISNLIYINNPFALQARITGKQSSPDFNPKDLKSSKAITLAFGYFNLNLPKQKGMNNNSEQSHKGFWRLPRFNSRSHLSRIINLESFVKQRVIKLKEKNDNENITEKNKTGDSQKTNPSKSIVATINRETDKLLKNIILIVKDKKIAKIEISRWLQGIDVLNYYILNYLDEVDKLPKDIKEVNNLLTNTSRVSVWIIYNLLENSEDNKERIELIRTVQDILLGFSIYNFLYSQRYTSSTLSSRKNDEFLLIIKRALHRRYIINTKFPEFKNISEHSQLTYEDVLAKLPNLTAGKKTIDILNSNKISKLKGLDEVIVFSNKADSLLFIKNSSTHMSLETILGEEKKFTFTAPLTKINLISCTNTT